jgi:hypothetical protein
MPPHTDTVSLIATKRFLHVLTSAFGLTVSFWNDQAVHEEMTDVVDILLGTHIKGPALGSAQEPPRIAILGPYLECRDFRCPASRGLVPTLHETHGKGVEKVVVLHSLSPWVLSWVLPPKFSAYQLFAV